MYVKLRAAGGDRKIIQFFALTSIPSLPAGEESESAVSREREREEGRKGVGRRRREPGSLRESFTYRVLQKERRTYCVEAGGKKEGCKGGRTLLHARAAVYICVHTHTYLSKTHLRGIYVYVCLIE